MSDPRDPHRPGSPLDPAPQRQFDREPAHDRYSGGPIPPERPEVRLPEQSARPVVGQAQSQSLPQSWAEPAHAPAPTAARPFGGQKALSRDATWVWTLYALILFAVPTFGVSAVVGLYGVLTRRPSDDPFLGSHEVYQARTLKVAAIGAVAGIVLIVVNLGVLLLFVTALWIIARGVAGVWRLRGDRPIADPFAWTI